MITQRMTENRRCQNASSTQRSLHCVRQSTTLWYLMLQSMKTMLEMMLNTRVLAKCLYTDSFTRFRLNLSWRVVATRAENTHLWGSSMLCDCYANIKLFALLWQLTSRCWRLSQRGGLLPGELCWRGHSWGGSPWTRTRWWPARSRRSPRWRLCGVWAPASASLCRTRDWQWSPGS